MSTMSRALALLALLQTHRHWPAAELAARLEVSERTVRRDVERLRDEGYPVEGSRGVDGGYQLAAGASLPPLVLDDEEGVAIVAALQSAAVADTDETDPSVRALTKVVSAMPAGLRRRAETLRAVSDGLAWGRPGPALDTDVLAVVAHTCRDSERLRFNYESRDATASQRLVEPVRLVSLSRRWYLVAYDLDRQDWRTFRLDRIAQPQGSGHRFRPREVPGGDPVAFVRAGMRQREHRFQVLVDVHGPADVVAERIGRWAQVEPTGRKQCRVTMDADGLEWSALALGLTGQPFTVVEPKELRELLQDWGSRFLEGSST